MNRIAIDVVLLPDETMTARAVQANAELVENCGSEVVLHPQTCLPHVSLAMGCVEGDAVEPVRESLEQITKTCPVGDLVITGVVTSLNARGQSVSLFAVAKTKAVQTLHERVMEAIQQHCRWDVSAEMVYGDEAVAETTLAWIRSFAEKAAFAAYFPHITIGYGSVTEPMTFPMPFTAPRLAVCHLGNHCTCREVLASVAL
ncbi:MAG: hypothetical protein ACYTAS_05330 [Planctomycetota bacterium]